MIPIANDRSVMNSSIGHSASCSKYSLEIIDRPFAFTMLSLISSAAC